jgi:hypothetical protein
VRVSLFPSQCACLSLSLSMCVSLSFPLNVRVSLFPSQCACLSHSLSMCVSLSFSLNVRVSLILSQCACLSHSLSICLLLFLLCLSIPLRLHSEGAVSSTQKTFNKNQLTRFLSQGKLARQCIPIVLWFTNRRQQLSLNGVIVYPVY